jgi:phosphoserine phosphatase
MKLVVLDMDGVLVDARSSWRVVHRYLGTQNEEAYRLYMNGEIDDMEFMRRDISLWKGRMPNITIGFIDGLFSDLPLTKGCSEALSDLRRSGFDLLLVSGGLDSLSDRISRLHHFTASYCNGLESDAEGRLSGEGILRVPLRDKGGVLRKYLDGHDYELVVSVGDSVVDVTMFEESDLSIAFRPMDDEARDGADISIGSDNLLSVSQWILERAGP